MNKLISNVVGHLVHDFANFVNLVGLVEVDVDTAEAILLLNFASAVYIDSGSNELLMELTQNKSDNARGVLAVIWYLRQKKIDNFKICNNFVICDTSQLKLDQFPPMQYLLDIGVNFDIQANGIKII